MNNAVKSFFEPRSVAVIGASRTPGRAGHQQLVNLKAGFKGDVYAVNPSADSIEGIPCYPSVADIPAVVELAIVLTPGAHVPEVVETCVEARVRAVLIPASGFAESSNDGHARQQRLLDKIRGTHTRLWGPNCAGLLNLHNHLLASFVEYPQTRKGGISIVSQTGTYALGLFRNMMEIPSYGISKIATIGNACDINEADVLEYLAGDDDTKIIALHLEGVPGGARTFELCREITRTKPVLAVVAGQTPAGQQASLSHTAGLATDARVVRGLLDQAGAIWVRDFSEVISLTHALSVVATPRVAKRIAVVSTSGAACVLSADLLSEAGLEVATLSPAGKSRLAPLLPDPNSVRNPIDVSLASLTYGNDQVLPEVTRVLFEDPQVDAALFAMGAFAGADDSWFSPKMLEPGKSSSAKPAVAWSYGPREYLESWVSEFESIGVPTFHDLRAAVDALAAIDRAATARQRVPALRHPPDKVKTKRAQSLVQNMQQEPRTLTEPQARELLRVWGIEGPSSIVATNETESLEAARRIGFPVVVKGISSQVTHKRDAGLVALDLRDEEEIKTALRRMPMTEGFLIQEMIRGGVELVAGFTRTETLGTVLMLGVGGSLVETLAEVIFRAPPLDETEADRMIDQSSAGRFLESRVDAPASDRAALKRVLLQLSQLAEANLNLHTVEINPLVVLAEGKGALALDALGVLALTEGE